MLNLISFIDFRMFKGKHDLELKPLTILTGPNNCGKSTLVQFVYSLIKGSKGDLIFNQFGYSGFDQNDYVLPELFGSFDSDESQVSTQNKEVHIRINDISYHKESIEESRISFWENNLKVVNIYPNTMLTSEPDFDTNIEINMDRLSKMKCKYPNDKAYYKRFSSFKKNLQFALENHSKEDFSKFSFGGERNLSRFKLSFDESILSIQFKTDLSIRTKILQDSIYSRLNSDHQELIRIILEKEFLDKDFQVAIIDVINFTFKSLILEKLYNIANLAHNNHYLSAYRGSFIRETGSQADLSFQNYLKTFHQRFSFDLYGPEKKFINKWLETFEIAKGIKIINKQLGIFKLELENQSERYPIELGFGNQQLLPLIMEIGSKPKGLFFIQEPESHLHPNLQSKLADFFTDAIRSEGYDSSKQIIVETHSEYLIRKLQFLVAKKTLNPDDIALYYIHRNDAIPPGMKQIQRMNFNKDGSLDKDFGSGFLDEADNIALDLFNMKMFGKN